MDFKYPTNKAEMDALRKTLVQEIDDDELEAVAGGNDDLKGKSGTPFTCPACGKTFTIKKIQDAAKHITQDCPNNPYK